jgi:2-C-methyl-D-erythritol 4-phosphate cytidylyltransferase
MKDYALIVAGGSGTRMGSDLPKQFMLLQHIPVLVHTLRIFEEFSVQLVVVLPKDYLKKWQTIADDYGYQKVLTVIGGATRFESVKNGLVALKDQNSLVAIHDAVRPLASAEMVKKGFEAARKHDSAVPVIPVIDSLRMKVNNRSQAADRKQFMTVQTPQIFKLSKIRQAYDSPYNHTFTDDATVFEHLYGEVHLFEGQRSNIKITTPEDLKIAESLMQ